MMTVTPPNRLPRLAPRIRLVLWAPVVLLMLVGFPLKAWHDRQVQRQVAQYAADLPIKNAQADVALARIKLLHQRTRHPPYPTLADVQRDLNGGRPLERLALSDLTYRWTDPASGRVFDLNFAADGTWRGYSTHWSSSSTPSHLDPPPPLLDLLYHARRTLLGRDPYYGIVLWFALFVAYASAVRWRGVSGELLLWAALLTTVLWTLNPAGLLTPGGLVRNDGLFWSIIGVPISGLLLASAFRHRVRPTPGLCPICGYDLRATPDLCPECGNVPAALVGPVGTKELLRGGDAPRTRGGETGRGEQTESV